MKKLREWFIDAPWGKIALASWGNPAGEPVLMVHGRQDSLATFIPVLEYLPDNLHYVGVDLPGHGWSDPMPTGVMLTRFHFLAAVEYAIKHLNWDQFIFIGHSMGCEKGLFFNIIYPNRIKEFIFFDPIPSLQRLQIHNFQEYYKMFYEEYYKNYKKYNSDDRIYTKRKAIEAVMKTRDLSEELAEIVLSRNLWPVGEDKYRLSWDKRLKYPATANYPPQQYFELFSMSIPPTLIISATVHSPVAHSSGREVVEALIAKLQKTAQEYVLESVVGGHDVHLTDAKVVGGFVTRFLRRNRKAKL